MNTVKATWTNGQVILDQKANWPEGSRLCVSEEKPIEIDFMTEEEQSDDPEAIQKWIDELRAIPAVPLDTVEEADLLSWQEKMKAFNIEAVRQKMEGGDP